MILKYVILTENMDKPSVESNDENPHEHVIEGDMKEEIGDSMLAKQMQRIRIISIYFLYYIYDFW